LGFYESDQGITSSSSPRDASLSAQGDGSGAVLLALVIDRTEIDRLGHFA
jgi:hypothetical protein